MAYTLFWVVVVALPAEIEHLRIPQTETSYGLLHI